MTPRNLEEVRKEVEKIRDNFGKPVEGKIKPLVIGLRRWGIKTRQSCEGHLSRALSYPWVSISKRQVSRVVKIMGRHNGLRLPDGKKNRNIWVLRPGGVLRLMPEEKNRDLEGMQKDAIERGLFLQNLPDEW